jgi:hypothetical protein
MHRRSSCENVASESALVRGDAQTCARSREFFFERPPSYKIIALTEDYLAKSITYNRGNRRGEFPSSLTLDRIATSYAIAANDRVFLGLAAFA